MPIWFDLDKVNDESYFNTAPIRFEYTMHLDASADEVWEGLTANKPLLWCTALNGRYTSNRPFGVGTTRDMNASLGLIRLKERFFEWDEEQRRHAFYVEKANSPAFKQFAELYEVTPHEQGCIFVWKFAMTPRKGLGLPLKLASPAAKKVLFDGFIRDTVRHFGKVK